ncbi:MAG: hypothetical protein L6R37_002090 [Teloschistes peruensis]|nr:MAG: hypothetical protein L6R37_002090 [Teloschistes peruensis]
MAAINNVMKSQESLDQSEDAAIAQKSTELMAPESRKQPPAESQESIRVRQLVILSFWTIVIFLGIPIWWWTTSIHRATLPLKEMMNWAEGKACRPTFPLEVMVEGPSLQENEIMRILRATQHALDDQNESTLHHLRLSIGHDYARPNSSQEMRVHEEYGQVNVPFDGIPELKEKALTIRLLPQTDLASARIELEPHTALLKVSYPPTLVPPASSSSFPLATFVAAQLQNLFAEEQAILTHAMSSGPVLISSHQSATSNGQSSSTLNTSTNSSKDHRAANVRVLSSELATRLASRSTRVMKYAPTYHITISLFSSGAWPSSWDIEGAIAEDLAPLLDSASGISNFTIDTQTQLFASLSPSVQQPQYDPEYGVWTLKDEDLSGFINAAEWPLSPSTGAGPTLNFVIYVPDSSTAPLVIKGSQATSWLIPQWGGVVILNPPETLRAAGSRLSKEELQPVLSKFSHQLLSFLGAPQSPPSIPLQLQSLMRIRAASLLLSASSTLGSLARLTLTLSSIAIPETVSAAVEATMDQLGKTCEALRDGRFEIALGHARAAEMAAERSFFEKSMVGQVYFPDEHKVAVYLPLLGPVGVPLMMSGLKELRRVFMARRLKAKTR